MDKKPQAMKAALENIAKAMAALELEKLKGYKKMKESKDIPEQLKDDEDSDLVKVLEAKKED